MRKTRTETDSIGAKEIPENVYYGVQSARAAENFQITGNHMHPEFIRSLAKIKKAAARANRNSGGLSENIADAVIRACDEVILGKFDGEFIVDPIQGGAGTSANMNMNEVIANRANELLGGKKGAYDKVHPNDHVNMSQSTNDVIPTAGKMTSLYLLHPLLLELKQLEKALLHKSVEFENIIKMGRTQLQDAVPMALGQTFHAYAVMIRRAEMRIEESSRELYSVNLGGTAIGSCINASPLYLSAVVPILRSVSDLPLVQADDLFDATENLDSFTAVSGSLKSCAVSLSKMCNDLRLLSSGPRCGLHEITLPAMQNGSSIMPGKINPVIPEVVTQTAFRVIGQDTAITMAAEAGQMELNAFEPVLFFSLFDSITSLTGAVRTLTANCIRGITAEKEHCEELLHSSVGIATALCPSLGYRKSAEIAKHALKSGKTVRELVLEEDLMKAELLDQILDPGQMIGNLNHTGQKAM